MSATALVNMAATGFRSLAIARNPSFCAAMGIPPNPEKASQTIGKLPLSLRLLRIASNASLLPETVFAINAKSRSEVSAVKSITAAVKAAREDASGLRPHHI